ncbi:hypothetical protein GGF50DRAFT_116871 [Schizophyllum commune]
MIVPLAFYLPPLPNDCLLSLLTFFIVADVDLCHIVADLDFDIGSSPLDVDEEGLSARVSGRLSATPWNRPAASRRPAGARPQRGPRVNLLNWRANWRLGLRGRFWLRSWGNQIESQPGYSVPPSIEMDAASRCILAPRQVATESAVEGACGPHVFVVVFASSDWALGCVTSRPQDDLQGLGTTCKPSSLSASHQVHLHPHISRPTSPSIFFVKMDGRARGWWWGTSECTNILSTLMVRFGVGVGRANSVFVNVQQRQDSRSPSSHVKVAFK